ncbi:hypothetical protein NDU88_001903 [Pleurodeles waltl]|uniref:Uncharacterized protein n=1 Tax=Pleurodeles waltl TaxID=8319 RepID=A0AAV7P6U6_PLEWA|nr:hypothetical protein NDU88_001903 [Pleurodeles waltl]
MICLCKLPTTIVKHATISCDSPITHPEPETHLAHVRREPSDVQHATPYPPEPQSLPQGLPWIQWKSSSTDASHPSELWCAFGGPYGGNNKQHSRWMSGPLEASLAEPCRSGPTGAACGAKNQSPLLALLSTPTTLLVREEDWIGPLLAQHRTPVDAADAADLRRTGHKVTRAQRSTEDQRVAGSERRVAGRCWTPEPRSSGVHGEDRIGLQQTGTSGSRPPEPRSARSGVGRSLEQEEPLVQRLRRKPRVVLLRSPRCHALPRLRLLPCRSDLIPDTVPFEVRKYFTPIRRCTGCVHNAGYVIGCKLKAVPFKEDLRCPKEDQS